MRVPDAIVLETFKILVFVERVVVCLLGHHTLVHLSGIKAKTEIYTLSRNLFPCVG